MRQFLRKSALVALLSAVALCGPAQQATAQPQVKANGVGDLLFFSYWTSADRDTLISITNAFGGQATRFVHIRLREGVASAEVANFTICLSPGDVWTAAISSTGTAGTSSLNIGDPGSCDASVAAGQGLTAPPAAADAALGLAADFGYIEAYTVECTAATPTCPGGLIAPTGNNNGGDDTLMGTATLVSAASGFSSSYNATALTGFDATGESASASNAAGLDTFGGIGARANIEAALANEGGVNKQVLMGRWSAETANNSSTDVVITYPTGGMLRGALLAADPVSIWVFDEAENFNFSPRSVTLDREVNVCTFQNGSVTATGLTQLTCNGAAGLGGVASSDVVGPGGTFDGGWFRIINNNDFLAAAADVDGQGDGTGVELDNINALPDSAFPAIGMIFSVSDGTAGNFDQVYGMQWAAVYGQGGYGGTNCITSVAAPIPPAACRAFDISSTSRSHCLAGNISSSAADCTAANDHISGNPNTRSNSKNR